MFHIASTLFWIIAQPLGMMAALLALSVLFMALRRWRLALISGSFSFAILTVSAWTTLGALLLHPLEHRFAVPDPAPETVDGIIVLGGAFEGSVNKARGSYELNDAGDRFVAAAVLARKYPTAPILISGGSAALFLADEGDAHTAPRLMEALGVSRDRLILENRSRDTMENALYSRALVPADPAGKWLLVTSAFHMPRAVSAFRKADFLVTPWPVDYRTTGNERFGLARDNAVDSLQNMTIGLREWVALAAYRLTGRIESVFP